MMSSPRETDVQPIKPHTPIFDPTPPDNTLQQRSFVENIRSCYQNDPEAFSYYEALVDYIEKGPKKCIPLDGEKPRVFQARSAIPSLKYPFPLPLEPLEWSHRSDRPRVVLLEGFPSPDAILQLAQRWSLRPEFFIEHLFGNQTCHRGFYSVPNLLSRQENIIRIRFSSLVKSLVEGPSMVSYLHKRSGIEKACQEYEKRLFDGSQYGVTRFREINQFDSYYCSVEQTISFTVVANTSPWVAIYLTDEGKSLLQDVRLPWARYDSGASSLNGGTIVGTVPIVPYNAPITSQPFEYRHSVTNAATNADQDVSPSSDSSRINNNRSNASCLGLTASFGQLHPLRNIVAHDEIDMEFLSTDPFFLLASLFTTSALSFVQLLNYLSTSISEDRKGGNAHLNIKLERLRHCVGIIYRVESSITENLQWVNQGGCSSWPRVRPGSRAAARKKVLQERLVADYAALQQRCVKMRQDCETGMGFLLSYSQLLCGEESTSQSAEMSRLTRLASFFVPLALVTSAFGMNTKEIQDSYPPTFVFVIVAVVISIATYTAMFSSVVWDWVRVALGRLDFMFKQNRQKKDVESGVV